MQLPSADYPVKLISRTLPTSRMNRLRACWFVLGVGFGIGCALSVAPLSHYGEDQVATLQEDPATALQSSIDTTKQDPEDRELSDSEERQALEAIISTPPAGETRDTTGGRVAPPLIMSLRAGNGDTLQDLLIDSGIPRQEVRDVTEAVRSEVKSARLSAGQTVEVRLSKNFDASDPLVSSVTVPVSVTTKLQLTRTADDRFETQTIVMPVEQKIARASAKIRSSFYQSGAEAGLTPSMLSELINAYSYNVDFQREIHPGDALDVLYERTQTKEGEITAYGNVIYAELKLDDRTERIYRYVDRGGNADYFNDKGESIRKALLRTPINGARITSGYGMRSHPLLGYSRMHRGVDFGAPTGTPIYAAGDGVVEFVGRKGGYGNYLKLNHNDKFASAYGHISRFAEGISPGRKVKQGQIIAYVGNTGISTGPHLHYEIMVGGDQVNPANVKFKTGTILSGKELAAFKQTISRIENQLASIPQNGTGKLAMADIKGSAN